MLKRPVSIANSQEHLLQEEHWTLVFEIKHWYNKQH